MAWDPAQYLKFAGHRLRPALDLLSRIDLADPARVYDLGAGAGNVTRLIKARWPDAQVTGVDDSSDMLAAARAAAPDIAWEQADLATWTPAQAADLIYSNAALHWLDGHERLFPALFDALAPGGVLAVQMPRNWNAPSHTSITDAARSGPWRAKLEPLLRPSPVADPAVYFDVLAPRAAAIDLWETEYYQVLEGERPVVEWVKGTWLRPLLAALDQDEQGRFETSYAERVAQAYPPRPDGRTLFPFRRLFIVATAHRR
jgi:trans-aconitate 2-methyltransferase